MNPNDFWITLLAAGLAFVFGLITKLLYDVWKEQREKKLIVFKKTIVSAFVVNSLDKEIREQTKVYYADKLVESIHIVRLDVENRVSKPVRNQTVYIDFGKEARIIGEPTCLSSPEDMRHVESDKVASQVNSLRYLVYLLLGKRTLSWRIAIINFDEQKFSVTGNVIGSSNEEYDKADTDVESSETFGSLSPDLTDRMARLVAFLIGIIVLSLMRETIELDYFVPDLSKYLTIALNVGIIGLWIAVLNESIITIRLLMQWLEEWKEASNYSEGDTISIGDISDVSGVSIGRAASANVLREPIGVDFDTMRQLLIHQAESIVESPAAPGTQDYTDT